ncbi:hypothetical protein A3Q56_03359 [Intoshia linei]|uniref:Mitochondrial-processing peptidase subunit beta n=1 Tax=Intoshia linei TaxID=1819745 RepID=A0A177B3I4_9BILA|nr:hypothetical protein A3Q56_03359 [Intoshia linei]
MLRTFCSKLKYNNLSNSVSRCLTTQPKKTVTINYPETKVSKLENGLRVASEDYGLPTSTIGLYIDVGSRFENSENNGTCHFLEHMAFKGTTNRTSEQLELEVENMGAQLNAYTSREQTVYYAKCFSKDIPKALEILTDIVTNSVLGHNEIERERGVILREVEEIDMNAQEVLFDQLHATAFQGTSLGYTILGPTKNIKSITKKDLLDIIGTHYKAPRVVLAAAGGINHDELHKLAEQNLGKLTCHYESVIPERLPCRFTGSEIRHRDDNMPLAHMALAVQSGGWEPSDSITLMIASALVGCWDCTQGGFQQSPASNIAKYCDSQNVGYSFQSFNTCYSNTGLWGIYFVCDKDHISCMETIILDEWMKLCSTVTDFEVQRAKNILKTNLALSLDGTTAICEEIGRQLLCYSRRANMHEICQRIDAVDAEELKRVCMKYIYDKCPAYVGLGPIEQMSDYNSIRSRMYKVENLKKQLEESRGDRYISVKLIYKGKIMNNEDTLNSYGLKENAYIVVLCPKTARIPSAKKEETEVEKEVRVDKEESKPEPKEEKDAKVIETPTPEKYEESIKQLQDMGFPRNHCIRAIVNTDGDLASAVSILLATNEMGQDDDVEMNIAEIKEEDESTKSFEEQLKSKDIFKDIKNVVKADPHLLNTILSKMQVQNPDLLNSIKNNEDAFIEMLNADTNETQQTPQLHIEITQKDKEAIKRLEDNGNFTYDNAFNVYIAFEKNEEKAAKYLLKKNKK